MTLGQRIAHYRKTNNITQEKLGELCEVSPQAVSKWENDISAPDIALIPKLADLFNITTDELLGAEKQQIKQVEPQAVDRKKLLIKIKILSSDGDKVNLNLPFSLIEMLAKNGNASNLIGGNKNKDYLQQIDFEQIIEMVNMGVLGKIVDIQSADGDTVEIVVEQ